MVGLLGRFSGMASAMLETVVCDEHRVVLERWVGAQRTPQSVALRARIVLLVMWRARFAQGGPAALAKLASSVAARTPGGGYRPAGP